jgi:hypothetical protein
VYVEGPSSYVEAVDAMQGGALAMCLPTLDEYGDPLVKLVVLHEPTVKTAARMYAPDRATRAVLAVDFATELRRVGEYELP